MAYHSPQRWKKGNNQHERLDHKLFSSLSGSRIPRLKQLKYLSRVLSPKENLIVKVLLGVVLINLCFLGVQLYYGATELTPRAGGRYVEGLVGAPHYINPILLQNNDSDRDLARLLYSGLTKYNEERKIVPDLAEKYELSADQKVYTFTLRKDVTWHDGKPLSADDVIFTIDKIKDPALKSPLYVSFKDVGVEKVDDQTVKIVLPRPFSPFLDLTTVGILPQHLWESIVPESFNLASLNLKPVGSGAWKFKTIQKDRDGTIRSYTIIRNEQYHGKTSYVNEIVFKFYPDTDSAVQALKNRNVDGISYLPRTLRDKLVQDTGLGYYVFDLPQYTALFFNQMNNPDLKSSAVRQALAYTVDKNALVQTALNGEGRPIDAPLLEGFLGYDASLKKYPYDPKKASDLLVAAGWEKDEKGMWIKVTRSTVKPKKNEPPVELKKRALHVTLVTVNQDENVKVIELLKDGWVKNGFAVDVQLVDSSRVKQDVIDPRNYEAFLYGEIIGSDPDLYPFWHSSQTRAPGLNLAVFSDQTADKLLEQGRETADQEKRASVYKQFQQILTENVPALFLYNPTYNYVVSKKVQGITDKKQIVYPSDRFLDLNEWYIKSKRTLKRK